MVIEDVLVNQPAARAGLRPGDVLVGVGAVQFSSPANVESQLSEASKLIRGKAGTPVDVSVRRGTERLTFHLVRANLQLPSVFERRFGHVYLVCATGKPGEEMLALLETRLGNDPDTERSVVRAELAKINRIRLKGLLA